MQVAPLGQRLVIETYTEMQAREKQERIEKSKDRQSASMKPIQNENTASVLFYFITRLFIVSHS